MSSSGSEKVTEIERKFLVRQLPELAAYHRVRMLQGYVAIEESGTEVRVRATDNTVHVLTVKTKGELIRGEYETPITAAQFDALWPTTEGRRVEKDRYTVRFGLFSASLWHFFPPLFLSSSSLFS